LSQYRRKKPFFLIGKGKLLSKVREKKVFYMRGGFKGALRRLKQTEEVKIHTRKTSRPTRDTKKKGAITGSQQKGYFPFS